MQQRAQEKGKCRIRCTEKGKPIHPLRLTRWCHLPFKKKKQRKEKLMPSNYRDTYAAERTQASNLGQLDAKIVSPSSENEGTGSKVRTNRSCFTFWPWMPKWWSLIPARPRNRAFSSGYGSGHRYLKKRTQQSAHRHHQVINFRLLMRVERASKAHY